MALQGARPDAAERRFAARFNQRVAGLGGRIAALRAPSTASKRRNESTLQEQIARLSGQLTASIQSPSSQPQRVARAVANGEARLTHCWWFTLGSLHVRRPIRLCGLYHGCALGHIRSMW